MLITLNDTIRCLIGLAAFCWGLYPLTACAYMVSFTTMDSTMYQFAPADSVCGGSGHPIADGTIVEIWWGRGALGLSSDDHLAPLENANFDGSALPLGVHLYRLQAGDFV